MLINNNSLCVLVELFLLQISCMRVMIVFFVFIYLMYYLNDSQGAISCNEKAFSCAWFNKIKYGKCNADAGKNDRENVFFIIILYYFNRQQID